MYHSQLYQLFAMMLMSSHVAHATFQCDSDKVPRPQLGFCAVNATAVERQQLNAEVIVQDAKVKDGGFTCQDVKVYNILAYRMFCCYADHVRAPETGYLTAKFAADHCYSREEPKPKKP
ncbi:hypothetical protein Pst134EA_024426 [Puccinia striiformis f. sp. tritici]|uniref:hypothetical protein n=1 Tax=Puccinia striiformis f. sp. tritici TaxID=168172 RepID=UPI000A12A30B|nr:hypothetical protein Pst134EA_024426 [Puccinia striiformis f. sp. tritici]KAH9453557.1 hypothetical protein Pst134EA_024426 [Puccinia striiformis f. sp. tritici]